MARRSKEPFLEPVAEPGPFKYACDRCGEREARRWGVATVMSGERGGRQQRVGLCDPCAACCAAPGSIKSSSGDTEHSFVGNGRRG